MMRSYVFILEDEDATFFREMEMLENHEINCNDVKKGYIEICEKLSCFSNPLWFLNDLRNLINSLSNDVKF